MDPSTTAQAREEETTPASKHLQVTTPSTKSSSNDTGSPASPVPDPPIIEKASISLFESPETHTQTSGRSSLDVSSLPLSSPSPAVSNAAPRQGSTPGRGRKGGASSSSRKKGGRGRGFWGGGHNLFYEHPSPPGGYGISQQQYGGMSPMVGSLSSPPMVGPNGNTPKGAMLPPSVQGNSSFGMSPQGFYNLGVSSFNSEMPYQQQQYGVTHGYGSFDSGDGFQGNGNYPSPPESPMPPPTSSHKPPSPHMSPLFVSHNNPTQPTDTVYFDSSGTPISSPARVTEHVENLSMPASAYGPSASYSPQWNIYGSPHMQPQQSPHPSSPLALSPLAQIQHMQQLQSMHHAPPPSNHGYVMPAKYGQTASVPPQHPPPVPHFNPNESDVIDQNQRRYHHQQYGAVQLTSTLPQTRDYQLPGRYFDDTYDPYKYQSMTPMGMGADQDNGGYEKYYPGPPIQSVPGPAGLTGPDGCNLFVFHIPSNFTNLDMFYLFQPCGAIVSVRIMTEAGTGRGRGFGFVSYEEPNAARLAIETLNGCQVGTKRLKVQFKERRGNQRLYATAYNAVENNSESVTEIPPLTTLNSGDNFGAIPNGGHQNSRCIQDSADTSCVSSASTSPSDSKNTSSDLSNSNDLSINDFSVSSDTSPPKSPSSPDREELLTEDLKGLNVSTDSSSPPQCDEAKKTGDGEEQGGEKESKKGSPSNDCPLLTNASTTSSGV